MIHLFLDCHLQPILAFLLCPQAACAVRASLRVVVPGRIGNQRAALDPVHVIRRRGDEVRLVHSPLEVDQFRAQGQDERGLQLAGVAHPADGGFAFGLQRGGALRAIKIQFGCGAENVRMPFAGVLDHVDQERDIPTVAGEQVEAVEAAPDERIHDCQPEILERPSADVERAWERAPVRADPIRADR